MYTAIHEPIDVAGVYLQSKFIPRKFRWRNQEFKIHQITLQANTTDRSILKRLYSVMVGTTVYRLSFNRTHENWILEEVWNE